MEKFNKNWKKSKNPKKQRKYKANSPLHIKRKKLGSNLSKELRKELGKRTIELKKGDKVKIMRGQFKGKMGEVEEINIKRNKVYITGINVIRKTGEKARYPIKPSNIQIITLNKDDKKRFKQTKTTKKKEQ